VLNYKDLAIEINKAIDAKDKNGQLPPPSPEMEAYSKAILTLIQASTTHPTGTVLGTTTAASPLTAGSALNGILVGFLPASYLSELQTGFPTADPSLLAKDANTSVTYINSSAKINFQIGNIIGTCTSTPTAPGPLLFGAGNNGTIDGLDGASWAQLSVPPTGDPALAEKIYSAIVKYINTTAKITYPTGTVSGTCPTAAGPLTLGIAANGVIS
jgi:hypothetical protein